MIRRSVALSCALASQACLDLRDRFDPDEEFPCATASDCIAGFICAGSLCRAANVCGNGVREGAEVCDGEDLGGATCASAGLGEGVVGCRGDCSVSTRPGATGPTPAAAATTGVRPARSATARTSAGGHVSRWGSAPARSPATPIVR